MSKKGQAQGRQNKEMLIGLLCSKVKPRQTVTPAVGDQGARLCAQRLTEQANG